MADNNDKQRKSEAEDIRDEADNAGRFAGDDADAQNARNEADRQAGSSQSRDGDDGDTDRTGENSGVSNQPLDYTGEAQNVTEGLSRPLTDEDAEHARNKANESDSDR